MQSNNLIEIQKTDSTDLFDAEWYTDQYPDVVLSSLDPLRHYLDIGSKLGRSGSYRNLHKLSEIRIDSEMIGRVNKIFISTLFDTNYYITQLPEKERETNPILHYLEGGWKQYDPNRYFSTAFYLSTVKNISNTPLEDFIDQEFPFTKNPSKIFNNSLYYLNNPDVANARCNPLWHYISSGISQNRMICSNDSDLIEAKVFFSRNANKKSTGTVLYNVFCNGCDLTELQKETIIKYKKNNWYVILIINSSNVSINYKHDDSQNHSPDCVILRENVGFDFGAWKHAIKILPWLAESNRLILTNDSVFPISDEKLNIF